jgi:hypothetical protein
MRTQICHVCARIINSTRSRTNASRASHPKASPPVRQGQIQPSLNCQKRTASRFPAMAHSRYETVRIASERRPILHYSTALMAAPSPHQFRLYGRGKNPARALGLGNFVGCAAAGGHLSRVGRVRVPVCQIRTRCGRRFLRRSRLPTRWSHYRTVTGDHLIGVAGQQLAIGDARAALTGLQTGARKSPRPPAIS